MDYDSIGRIKSRSDVGTYEYGSGCAGGIQSPFVPKKIGAKSFCTDGKGNIVNAGRRTPNFKGLQEQFPCPLTQYGQKWSLRISWKVDHSIAALTHGVSPIMSELRVVGVRSPTKIRCLPSTHPQLMAIPRIPTSQTHVTHKFNFKTDASGGQGVDFFFKGGDSIRHHFTGHKFPDGARIGKHFNNHPVSKEHYFYGK
jgi:hypothetical protein